MRALCEAQPGEGGRAPGGGLMGKEAREQDRSHVCAKLQNLLGPECSVVSTKGASAEWGGQICI